MIVNGKVNGATCNHSRSDDTAQDQQALVSAKIIEANAANCHM